LEKVCTLDVDITIYGAHKITIYGAHKIQQRTESESQMSQCDYFITEKNLHQSYTFSFSCQLC